MAERISFLNFACVGGAWTANGAGAWISGVGAAHIGAWVGPTYSNLVGSAGVKPLVVFIGF